MSAHSMTPEDISNKISGYKATLSNPNVSEEAKKNAEQELKNLNAGSFNYEDHVQDEQNKNPNNVAGGLKAAINNPDVTPAGTEMAQQKLDDMK